MNEDQKAERRLLVILHGLRGKVVSESNEKRKKETVEEYDRNNEVKRLNFSSWLLYSF
jgi:hypothetical protein